MRLRFNRDVKSIGIITVFMLSALLLAHSSKGSFALYFCHLPAYDNICFYHIIVINIYIIVAVLVAVLKIQAQRSFRWGSGVRLKSCIPENSK